MESTSLSEYTHLEHLKTAVYTDADSACRQVAGVVAELIRERSAVGESAVLGLATGSTPVRLYRELIRMHREEGLSFQNVVTFNLDEYYSLSGDHPESY
jgi:glucosamine-6-phosphate deaminase